MSTQRDIKTFPRTVDWIIFVCGIIFFGGIAAILPLMVEDALALALHYSREASVITSRVIAGFGALVAGWFIWRLLNRSYWRLTEDELIGGRRGNLRLPLPSLEKIVIGLPNKFAIPGLENLAPPQIRASSILLCFSDGFLLPMHLHGLPNGSRVMEELISRFSDRVDQHYRYSDEEIKILRKADINVLIKKPCRLTSR